MCKKTTVIKASKEYTVDDLLQFGIGHLLAAEYLYKAKETSGPSYYDSAGYLSQLGIELILKAWLLYNKNQHPKIHKLLPLYKELIATEKSLTLSDKSVEWLTILDTHYQLRYPFLKDPVETGDDDWERTDKFMAEIYKCMPALLKKQIQQMSATEKGGRILMERRERSEPPAPG